MDPPFSYFAKHIAFDRRCLKQDDQSALVLTYSGISIRRAV